MMMMPPGGAPARLRPPSVARSCVLPVEAPGKPPGRKRPHTSPFGPSACLEDLPPWSFLRKDSGL